MFDDILSVSEKVSLNSLYFFDVIFVFLKNIFDKSLNPHASLPWMLCGYTSCICYFLSFLVLVSISGLSNSNRSELFLMVYSFVSVNIIQLIDWCDFLVMQFIFLELMMIKISFTMWMLYLQVANTPQSAAEKQQCYQRDADPGKREKYLKK